MDGASRSEHHLVILRRGPQGQLAVLLLKDGDDWALPRIESEERRSADVGGLNRAVRESLGLEVSVLRCLSDEPGDGTRPRRQLYALEAHGNAPGRALRGEWVARSALDTHVPAGSRTRLSLDAWRRTELKGRPRVARDWAQPGWRDGILAWAADQLSRHPPIRVVEQVRVWGSRTSSGSETDEARFYLKARPADGRPGAAARLAERHPPPRVIK
jgi:hypothetical protein